MLEAERNRITFTSQQRGPLQFTDGNPAVLRARVARFELVQAGLAALEAMMHLEGKTDGGSSESTVGDPILPGS